MEPSSSFHTRETSSRLELIREYYHDNYTNKEIRAILKQKNGIVLSERHLRRIMSANGLKRREHANKETIVHAVQCEIEGSGRQLGSRAMKNRLMSGYGIFASRETVRHVLLELDPEGVQRRKQRRLIRRVYSNNGPNYLIHVDGYDKLKKYGFAIHGAMCGFSRKVLWLKVARTNNDPTVVGSYFVDYLQQIGGVPRCVRMDCGTENILIEDIQKAFHWKYYGDDNGEEKCVLRGSSCFNQRIERWWLSVRQTCVQYWMEFFQSMETGGIFSSVDPLHKECMRFCFMELIQTELSRCCWEWNQHRIRKSKEAELPGGKPDLLFYLPENYGTVDYKTTVSMGEIEEVKALCAYPRAKGCDPDFERVCFQLMADNGRVMPSSSETGLELYNWLIESF